VGNELFCGKTENVLWRIVPQMGMALIFNHYMLHEGEMLKEKDKYIMRSDIIYKRKDFPNMDPKEREGIDWLLKAQQFEIDKNLEEATLCYKKAYKLWPDLEFAMVEM